MPDFYFSGFRPQQAANPDDPAQQLKWALGKQNAMADQGLWSPEMLAQLQTMFQPYFDKATANLNNHQTRDLTSARRSAGAQAAAGGYSNPYALQQRSQASVYDAYAPQFSQMQLGMMDKLFGASAQNQQFKYGNAQSQANLWAQLYAMNEQSKNQPSFWENLLGSAIPGLGAFIGGGGLSKLFGSTPLTSTATDK